MAAQDFGQVRRAPGDARRNRTIWIVAAIVVAGAVGTYETIQLTFNRAQAKAHEQEWSVTGPPCPSVTAAWVDYLQLHQKTPIAFEGLSGFMAAGAVNCSENDSYGGKPVKSYTVCQFSSPFVVGLRANAGAPQYFEPGVGKPITVALRDGQISCVMGAKVDDYWSEKTEDAG